MDLDRFMRETSDQWNSVATDLRCIQSLLEQVLSYWRLWDSLAPEFSEWLTQAEKAMQLEEEEKMEFFQDIAVQRYVQKNTRL